MLKRRQQLSTEIRQLDQRLGRERAALEHDWRQREAFLRRQPPLLLLGAGLLAGIGAGLLTRGSPGSRRALFSGCRRILHLTSPLLATLLR